MIPVCRVAQNFIPTYVVHPIINMKLGGIRKGLNQLKAASFLCAPALLYRALSLPGLYEIYEMYEMYESYDDDLIIYCALPQNRSAVVIWLDAILVDFAGRKNVHIYDSVTQKKFICLICTDTFRFFFAR